MVPIAKRRRRWWFGDQSPHSIASNATPFYVAFVAVDPIIKYSGCNIFLLWTRIDAELVLTTLFVCNILCDAREFLLSSRCLAMTRRDGVIEAGKTCCVFFIFE